MKEVTKVAKVFMKLDLLSTLLDYIKTCSSFLYFFSLPDPELHQLTLITKDSGLLSMEKLARDPKTSGADQCLGTRSEPFSRTSTLFN